MKRKCQRSCTDQIVILLPKINLISKSIVIDWNRVSDDVDSMSRIKGMVLQSRL